MAINGSTDAPSPVDAEPTVTGPWSMARIESYLDATVIPVRLATSGRQGPLVQSMWFHRAEGRLWCATQFDAVVVQRLRADPRVGFEIARDEPPYRGVRGQGSAELLPSRGPEILERLIERYLGPGDAPLASWLRSRSAGEVAIAIDAGQWATWDFTRRMQA